MDCQSGGNREMLLMHALSALYTALLNPTQVILLPPLAPGMIASLPSDLFLSTRISLLNFFLLHQRSTTE